MVPSCIWMAIHNQLICNPCFLVSFQAMCGLLQCGPVFDPNGLITGGYLYNWLQTVLNSPKEKVGFEREIQLLVLKYSALIGCRQFLDIRVSWLRQHFCVTHSSFFHQIHQLGHATLVHLLENNANIPSLLHWVIDKCYTGARLVVSGCFKALVSVFTRR